MIVTPRARRPRRTAPLAAAALGAAVALAAAAARAQPPAAGPDAAPSEAAPPLEAPPRSVLLLLTPAQRPPFEEALHLELAPRGVAVLGIDAPPGDTPLERAAAAQSAARRAGADAAIWVELFSPREGGGALLRAVAVDAAETRFAPLPAPLESLAPRTFALVAESLLDELVAPPDAPVRVRFQVSVEAPGREVTVTTLEPTPGTIEAQVEAVPEAPAAGTADPAADAAVVAAVPAPPALVLVPPGAAEGPVDGGVPDEAHPVVAFGGDLVPMVGTSSVHRGREIRRLSLNLGGGLSHGVDGVGVAAGFQIATGFAHGFLGSAGFNVVGGPQEGVTTAAGFNLTGGAVGGAQIAAGFNVAGGAVNGAQVAAGVNVAGEGVDGAQVAAGVNVAGGRVDGAQVAAGVNVAGGGVRGVQVSSGVNVAAGDVRGSQISAGVNVAAGEVDGLQLGVVNVSRTAGFALGLVNVFYGGRTNLELSGDATGFFHTRLKHGGDHFHYVYSVGGRPFDGGASSSLGIGLGGHATLGEAFFLDVEGLAHALFGEHGVDETAPDPLDPASQSGARGLFSARVMAGWQFLPKVALLAGVSYDVYVAEGAALDDGADYAPFGGTVFADGATVVRGWPSFTLGLQLF